LCSRPTFCRAKQLSVCLFPEQWESVPIQSGRSGVRTPLSPPNILMFVVATNSNLCR